MGVNGMNEKMENLQEKIYNEQSKKVDEQKDKSHRTEKVIKLIGNVRGKRILDVGCFNGEMISVFTNDNDCYGIDISEKPLEIAKKRGIKTFKINFESEKFPFKDNFFEIIICSEMLEHLINQDHCLQEIRRVLKKEGLFILTIPNINTPLSWFMQIFLDYTPQMSARYKSPHFRDFTKKIGESMLKINGFKIIKSYGLNINPFRGRISKFFADIYPRFSTTLIFKVKKEGEPKYVPEVIFDTRELFKLK
jgi:ubiquinone/menaquinone biosynthesis C-methylase UbiE